MVSKHVLFGLVAIATASAGFGCSSAPTVSQSSTTPAVVRTEMPSLNPLVGHRQVLVAGAPKNWEQLKAHLPARISDAQAATMIQHIDLSKVQKNDPRHVSVIAGRLGFYRGYGRLGNWWNTAGLGFHGYGGYMFPYYHRAGWWYPYSFATYNTPAYWPFLYCYGSLYLPYFYGDYADLCTAGRVLPFYGDYADWASGWAGWTYGCGIGNCGGVPPVAAPPETPPTEEAPPQGKEGQSGPGTGGGIEPVGGDQGGDMGGGMQGGGGY